MERLRHRRVRVAALSFLLLGFSALAATGCGGGSHSSSTTAPEPPPAESTAAAGGPSKQAGQSTTKGSGGKQNSPPAHHFKGGESEVEEFGWKPAAPNQPPCWPPSRGISPPSPTGITTRRAHSSRVHLSNSSMNWWRREAVVITRPARNSSHIFSPPTPLMWLRSSYLERSSGFGSTETTDSSCSTLPVPASSPIR